MVEERVTILGVSKSRWRCPECLRSVVDTPPICRVHGYVKPLDAMSLSLRDKGYIAQIGDNPDVKRLCDYAEEWQLERGRTVPPNRHSTEWEFMYQEYIEYAFDLEVE